MNSLLLANLTKNLEEARKPVILHSGVAKDVLLCNLNCVWFCNPYVSVNSNWVHTPGQPRGLAQKNCPGGRNLTFESCSGAGSSTSVINIGCPKSC